MSTVFLDRDGVINVNRSDYVKSWNEFSFLPGACEAIAQLTFAGHRIVVCTNQAGIAYGKIPVHVVEDIHRRMLAEVALAGGRIERVYYCAHGKLEGCSCRKPQPGLLLRASHELHLDLTGAVFVGDSITDIQAAVAAGIQPVLVLTGLGKEQYARHAHAVVREFPVLADLPSASRAILNGIHTLQPDYAYVGVR